MNAPKDCGRVHHPGAQSRRDRRAVAFLPPVLALLLVFLSACGPAATPTAIPTAARSTATRAGSPTIAAALPTPSPTAAATITPTATLTATPTAVATAMATLTPTVTPDPTATPTATPSAAPTIEATATPAVVPTVAYPPTVPPLPTATPRPPTPTPGGPTPTVPGPPPPVPPVVTGGQRPTPMAVGGVPSSPRPARAVTRANPLRVYVGGDSFAEWLGADIGAFGNGSGVVTTRTDGKISSGLANPAFFDWPARLTAALAGEPPDIVVFIVGANDLYAVSTPAGAADYRRRQGAIMDLVGARGAQLYWVGQPIMRDPGQAAAAREINTAAIAEARSRPWVRYIDSWALFTDSKGAYAGTLPDGGGRNVQVRQDDGLHLTREGTTWLASLVYTTIRRDWQLP